jgi:hypothetical protein
MLQQIKTNLQQSNFTLKSMKNLTLFLITILTVLSCGSSEDPIKDDGTIDVSNYTGTGSVTKGLATTTTANLFTNGQRVAGLGTIKAVNNVDWVVPAVVNYTENSFPFASELYNPYGSKYASASAALAALDGSDIIDIRGSGDLITGYIFADNYFELYVNGVSIGKDAVPFTDFNSHIVRFRVTKPYTIAMKLVDWEENLGLGSESQATPYHPGDGGMVAIFKDETSNIVAITNDDWRAQTYYTSPIQDLSCLSENGSIRSSANCSSTDATDGSNFYGIHWDMPSDWNSEFFDDSGWPNATTYTNNTIGVDNKPSYTNFTDIFDDVTNDAQFIWSTNVVLDNLVLVR